MMSLLVNVSMHVIVYAFVISFNPMKLIMYLKLTCYERQSHCKSHLTVIFTISFLTGHL